MITVMSAAFSKIFGSISYDLQKIKFFLKQNIVLFCKRENNLKLSHNNLPRRLGFRTKFNGGRYFQIVIIGLGSLLLLFKDFQFGIDLINKIGLVFGAKILRAGLFSVAFTIRVAAAGSTVLHDMMISSSEFVSLYYCLRYPVRVPVGKELN